MLEKLMPKKSKSNVYESPIKTPIVDKVCRTTRAQDSTSKPAKKYVSINLNRPPAPKTVKDPKAPKNKDTATTSSSSPSSKKAGASDPPKVRELNVKQSSDFLQGNDDFYDSMARFDNTAGFNTDFNKLNQDFSFYNNNTSNQHPTPNFSTDNLTANPVNFNGNLYSPQNSNIGQQYYQNPYQPNQTPKRYHF